MFVSAASFAQAPLSPPPLSQFDGQKWAGIVLGQTTDRELKSRFVTSSSPVRPEALRLRTNGPYVVDVLMHGRGESAVAQAIRVEYQAEPIDPSRLGLVWDEPARVRFAETRYTDWRIIAFPRRGVWLYATGEDAPRTAFLARPERVGAMLDGTTDKPSLFAKVEDPGADWNRSLEFGRADVDVIYSDVRSGRISAYGIENRIERELEYLRGNVNYDPRSDGVVQVRLYASRADSRGYVTYTANVDAEFLTPYGWLRESSSQSARLGSGSYRVLDLAFETIDDVLGDALRDARRLGPPTPAEMDERTLQAYYDLLARP